MEGAHDSLADAKAQMDVFLHPDFKAFVDKTVSVVPVAEVFGSKQPKQQEQLNDLKGKT